MNIAKMSALEIFLAGFAAVAAVGFIASGLAIASKVPPVPDAAPEDLSGHFTQRDRATASQFCGIAPNGNPNLVLAFARRDPQTGAIGCAAVCAMDADRQTPRKDWECGK